MTGPAFDDRYEARFQRGYVESGSDASGGGRAKNGQAAVREPGERVASGASGALDARGPGAASEAGRSTGAAESARPSNSPDGGPSEPDATAPTAAERGSPGAPIEPEPAGESPAVRRLFALAFGVCALALVLGIAWLWNAYTDDAYFLGGPSRSAWDELTWTVPPVMIEFGAGAAAAVAVWLGLRQAGRAGHERLFRLPAVIGLGVAVVAVLLVVVWIGSGPSQSSLWAVDPVQQTDEQRTELALGQLRSVLAGPVVRAGLLAVLGIVLIAARAAMSGGARGSRTTGDSGSEVR